MATRENINQWYSKSVTHPEEVEVLLQVHGKSYPLKKKYLVAKSGKLANLLQDNRNESQHQLSYPLQDVPGDFKTFEVAMRFCYGIEPNLSPENVIPLLCVAYHLDMTEKYSPNNLVTKALNFFQHKVLPQWNESVIAFQTTQQVYEQAVQLSLVDVCLDSIVEKARLNPCLLGEPFRVRTHFDESENNEGGYVPSAKRRLFGTECCKTEDLTILNLQLYELLMPLMIQSGIPLVYVAASLFRYAKKRAQISLGDDEDTLVYQREVIETVENLLPDCVGLLPCKLLSEMLQSAIGLQASETCRYGLEMRIGKQLIEASVEDLLIPSQGYTRESQFDIDSVKRILKAFYQNYTSPDNSGLITVAELTEEFLAKVASDEDLKKDTFIPLLEVSITTSIGINRNLDRIYRTIDIYLDKHSYLTESEREEVCQVLDCHKLSSEACTHAAQNERLPVRVVVQALFVGQLHLRETIVSSIVDSDSMPQKEEMPVGIDGEEVRTEMDKMDTRVIGLEKECCEMKKQLVKGRMKGKGSMWKGLKRKFGCISSMHDCNCHVKKKVHPRNGV